jgi:L-alanine-DL-glutamate epimerase-like enolase superfamily enzyme
MKIETIETIVLRIPFTTGGSANADSWGGKAWQTADALLVKVTTDEGIIGWGEAFGYNVIPATKAAIDHMLAPICVGRDPLAIESLLLDLQQKLHIFGRGGPVIFGLSGLDIALWDIAGKAAGKPLHQLLGGCRLARLPCYASLIRYTDPKLVASNVERALKQGFRHIKLHEIEVVPTRAAREVAGESVDIMLDVNCPWSLRQALDMAERLRPFNLRWLEEPLRADRPRQEWRRLRASAGMPLAAGENIASREGFELVLSEEVLHVVQPDIAKWGGLTIGGGLANDILKAGKTFCPHYLGGGIGLLASAHLLAGAARTNLRI